MNTADRKYVLVDLEGEIVHSTQEPEGVELIVVDANVYREPMLNYVRQDLEPYEKCATCGHVKKAHLDGEGPNLWEFCPCTRFVPTGETPAGDSLDDWEEM